MRLHSQKPSLIVPIVAAMSESASTENVGFVNPLGSSTKEKQRLLAGVVFIVADILEWLFITSFFLFGQCRNAKDRVVLYESLVNSTWFMMLAYFVLGYFGMYMWHATLDVFQPLNYERHFVDEMKAMNDQQLIVTGSGSLYPALEQSHYEDVLSQMCLGGAKEIQARILSQVCNP
jgi:hypothetical protein